MIPQSIKKCTARANPDANLQVSPLRETRNQGERAGRGFAKTFLAALLTGSFDKIRINPQTVIKIFPALTDTLNNSIKAP